jgi:hypothetical protein
MRLKSRGVCEPNRVKTMMRSPVPAHYRQVGNPTTTQSDPGLATVKRLQTQPNLRVADTAEPDDSRVLMTLA